MININQVYKSVLVVLQQEKRGVLTPVEFNKVTELEGNVDECVVLDKAINGLVQATCQFFKKLSEVLVGKLGFSKYMLDNCLLTWKTSSGTLILCVYIDNTLCIGSQKTIDEFKKDITEHFTVKEEAEMKEYIGCRFIQEGKRAYMHQAELIRKIKKAFEEDLHKSNRV